MQVQPTLAGTFNQQSANPTPYASTTVTTLAWGRSIAIVSTSTRNEATNTLPATTGRMAVSFQAVNCTVANADVWLSFNDVAAATTTGFWLKASTTQTFGDNVPNVYGAIKAIAVGGNCSIATTEWRTLN